MMDDIYTYLFYNKSSDSNNGYANKITKNITIDSLFSSNNSYIEGDICIEKFNTYNKVHLIPIDLNITLYYPYFFDYIENNTAIQILIIKINSIILEKHITDKINIPNKDFLIMLCKNHFFYNNTTNSINMIDTISGDICNKNSVSIIQKAILPNSDPTDPIQDQPEFAKIPLYNYQKRTIKWMLNRELLCESVYNHKNNLVQINNILYNVPNQEFVIKNDSKKIIFNGGALIDEVGLGKTYQMIITSLLNQAKIINYYQPNSDKLVSRATLIICPTQLVNQWINEFKKVIDPNYDLTILPCFTKTHFNKLTYQDILDCDFVVTSYNYLLNNCFLLPLLTPLKLKKSILLKGFDNIKANEYIKKIGKDIKNDYESLFKKNPNLIAIKWHRIIIDEFHEIETNKKIAGVKNIIKLFDSKYKWCLTATPFDKSNQCLIEMINFVTNCNDQNILCNKSLCEYMENKFFRRNTKKSVNDEYQLQPLKESVLQLNFSQTEWLIYNAYLANPDIDKYSVLLRQICCQPNIANEIKDTLSTCKTLDEIQNKMINHYKLDMNKAHMKANYAEYRVGMIKRHLKILIWKRQQKILTDLGYNVKIDFKDNLKELLILKEKSHTHISNIEKSDELDIEIDETIQPFKEYKFVENNKNITISDENQIDIIKLVEKKWNINMPKMISDTKNYELLLFAKLNEETIKYNGKKTTYEYFTNVLKKLQQINNNTSDSDDDTNEKETCSVCLGNIKSNDLGMTKCGHLFCYNCIKQAIITKGNCPICRNTIKNEEIHMIIKYSKEETNSIEFKDKQTLISKVGTKLANLIFFLKKNNKHAIIFSQWNNLLENVGNVLDEHGIQNVFCKGNVWQRNKAINDFNTNDKIKIIMLSSESSASGTNLTKAELVIILDPVYGSYEYRRNTEWQSIGRAYRMGQQHQVEVIRIIIRGTVEEDIYKTNVEEDNKKNIGKKIFELCDDVTELDQEKINEIINAVKKPKTKKINKLTQDNTII